LVVATFVAHTLIVGMGAVALAEPGPDPDVNSFDIFTRELPRIGGTEYDRTHFDTALGWDWGVRAAYSCAYVEFIQGGQILFEVHYEMVAGYPTSIEINDNAGAGEPVDGTVGSCGDGIGPEASITHDGTDHFPHGTTLEFSRDDQPLVTLDYNDDMCAQGYWTPGDQAGEAWLWWDEDGPQDTMPGMHDCGGGPGEPVSVVRAFVQNVAPGVTVCTTDMLSGDLCTGQTARPDITSFSPTSGAPGTSVTITGSHFEGATSVTFGGVSASFMVHSGTEIMATVPTGAASGPIVVSTPAGTGSSGSSFTVIGSGEHPRSVTLNLPGNRAKGTVRPSDGFAACAENVPVKVQRFSNGSWRTVASLMTGSAGGYKAGGVRADGRYRAIAAKVTLSSGDVCLRDRSPIARQ
jgi:uncharacterized protein (TIGR03437 family)